MKDYSKSQIPRLFSVMGEKNITAAQLCKAIGISSGNFSDWRSGKCKPTKAVLFALAQQLGVTPDYLLGNTEQKKPPASEDAESMGEYEKKLITLWNKIPEEEKPKLLDLIEAALRMREEH